MQCKIHQGVVSYANVYKYPDGQQNVVLDLNYYDDVKEPIEIIASIRNFSELELLLCAIAAFRKFDFYIASINFVYLFGMRSDRSFENGMCNYFGDVIAPIINSLSIKNIKFLQPHSGLSFEKINNSYAYSIIDKDNSIRIGGDASTKIWNIYGGNEKFDIFFDKKRVGRSIFVNLKPDFVIQIKNNNSPITIFDDLCDGGTTFLTEYDYLKNHFPGRKINLEITHAIFSQGIDILADKFDEIICTNSYQNYNHPKLTVTEVI